MFWYLRVSFLTLLLLPLKFWPLQASEESIKQWTSQCAQMTSCTVRSFKDDELMPSKFLMNFSCHCDDLCRRFGDCCLDYVQDACGGNKTCLGQFLKQEDYFSCRNLDEVDRNSGVYLVSRCPETWTDEYVRSQCEDPSNDTFVNLPVVNTLTGSNYRNLFCSICNGEDDDTLYWRVETCCKNVTQDDMGLGQNDTWDEQTEICETMYSPPNETYSYRPCKQSVHICPEQYPDKKVMDLCRNSSETYVYTKTDTYKNVYCALCNSVRLEDLYCDQQNIVPHRSLCHGKRRKLPYSFKVLLDMNTNSRTKSYRVGMKGRWTSTSHILREALCSENEVYDPFNSVCRKKWCQGYTVKNWSDNGNLPVALRCPWIRFNQTEYRLDVNGAIFIEAHQKIYQPADFRLSGGYAFVCVDFIQNYTEHQLVNQTTIAFSFSQTQVYLSLVGLVLSLLALAVQMIVYFILPTLRNVPGKNLMCLVGSLFVAELLFLIAPSMEVSQTACVTVAVLMHAAFLAAFSWMQVMSFDIWFTFSRKTLHSSADGKSNAFKFYQLYGWVTPIAIVAVAVTVDNVGHSDLLFRPWYGQGICWIANREGLLMFFAGPVALILLSNILFYILTVRSIMEVDKSTSMVHKNSEKRRFFLYVKLCFLMGVAWIFGFIAAFSDVQALWYVFVILNTLQGMFICVAFVCTKKVFRLLKEKCKCARRLRGRVKTRANISSATGKTSLSTRSTYAVLGQKVDSSPTL